MPLISPPADPKQSVTVHCGEMFAREVSRKQPRTPEANRMLISELRLPALYPTFVSPKRSFFQVAADTGFEMRDWMARKASVFNEREKAGLRVPLAGWWVTRGSGDDHRPPAPRARRRGHVAV